MIKSVVVERSTHDERRAAIVAWPSCSLINLSGGATTSPKRRGAGRGDRRGDRGRSPPHARSGATSSAPSRRLLRAADLSPTQRIGAGGSPTPPTPAPAPRRSRQLVGAAARRPAHGIRRSAKRSTQRSPPPTSSSTATATREAAHQLLLAAIDAALGEPDQDRDGLAEASTCWRWCATTQDVRSTGRRSTKR